MRRRHSAPTGELDATTAEIERIHVAHAARGMRIGAAIVAELEARGDEPTGFSRLVARDRPKQYGSRTRASASARNRVIDDAGCVLSRLHGEDAHRRALPFSLTSMLAVIVVRDGQLPAGADETISECGGRACWSGRATVGR